MQFEFGLVARKYAVRDPDEEVKRVYDLFGFDAGGVTAERLREICENINEEIPESTLHALVRELDSDGDGLVSFNDFKSCLLEAYSLVDKDV